MKLFVVVREKSDNRHLRACRYAAVGAGRRASTWRAGVRRDRCRDRDGSIVLFESVSSMTNIVVAFWLGAAVAGVVDMSSLGS